MLATLSAIVLMTGGWIGVTQSAMKPPIQTCSFIVGGFLNEPLSPAEALQQARMSIWNVYREHAATCIDLRIFTRPGVVKDMIFRSQQQNGQWRATIISAPGFGGVTQSSGQARHKDVERIERIEPAFPHAAAKYSLRIHLKDGSTLEL